MKFIKWIAFAVATILAFLTIFILPRLEKKMPPLPLDITHKNISKVSECLDCHLRGRGPSLPPDHPARDQCLYCHHMKNR